MKKISHFSSRSWLYAICFLLAGVSGVGVVFWLGNSKCYLKGFSSPVYTAQIIESNCIEDVLRYGASDNALVLFDLDNTLVHPGKEIGSDQWFSYLVKKEMGCSESMEVAIERVLPLYFKVHDHLSLYPTEKSSFSVPERLCQKNIKTAILTARSPIFSKRTFEQLQEAGVHFLTSFTREGAITLNGKVPAFYKDGIIFCGNNDKGEVLFEFLSKFEFAPEVIVFVDDKYNNLLTVEHACAKCKVSFIGIRYGGMDKAVENFDPERAETELIADLGACSDKLIKSFCQA